MALRLNEKTNVTDATLQKHIRAISAARSEMEEATAEYKKTLKTAKGDGCNTKQMVAAMKMRSQDIDKVKLNLRDYVRYLALCNMPMTQTDMFGAMTPTAAADGESDEHDIWEATEAGKAAGKAGHHRRDNPHHAGSESFVAWDAGYMDGQASIAKAMGPKAKVASTRRGKRANGGLPLDS